MGDKGKGGGVGWGLGVMRGKGGDLWMSASVIILDCRLMN